MGKSHHYQIALNWTGNTGQGTKNYKAYSRDHLITAQNKPDIFGSADPSFLGDPAHWNPEELLLASIAACHKLWYLHLCASNQITVEAYEDTPTGEMVENANGSGQFTSVNLRPRVTISAGDAELAHDLHEKVGDLCFIARSVNFSISHEAEIVSA